LKMHRRTLLGTLLLVGPLTVAVGVGISKYEWIWNRTSYSIPISCAASLLGLLAMTWGLYFVSDSRSKFIRRSLLLAAGTCTIQFLSIASDGAAHETKRIRINDGGTAFALRYAALGSSWTDVYVTQPKWHLLRETYHVRQYELAAITDLQTDGDKGLRVFLKEHGSAQTSRIDSYSGSDLDFIRRKVKHPPRL